MKTLQVGLIKGRHALPVDDYILDAAPDPLDFDAIRLGVSAFIDANCDIGICNGIGLDQAGYTDSEVYCSDTALVVYVTGLTAVTAEVIRQCAMSGIPLTLMHYNRDTDAYVPQKIFE